MTLMFAANLLAAAMATQAAVTPDATEKTPVPDHSWLEYQLAAAAQPGDAISDYVLAEGFRKQLLEGDDAAPLPAALRARLETERRRLMVQPDRVLMDDPVLLSMRLSCGEHEPEHDQCDLRRARLAEIDPENAYAAMVLMSVAFSRKDDAGFVRAASLGAGATRYEPIYHRVFASLDRRFGAIPDVAVPAMPRRHDNWPVDRSSALAVASALFLPAFQGFSQPCRHAEGELRADCVAIARRMLNNEAVQIDVLIGASVLEAVGNDDDRRIAEARKREVHWLQTQQYRLYTPEKAGSLAETNRYFDALVEGGELPAMRQVLRDHGVVLQPPADWTSKSLP